MPYKLYCIIYIFRFQCSKTITCINGFQLHEREETIYDNNGLPIYQNRSVSESYES